MDQNKKVKHDKDFLIRLFEYIKYVYEEERERTNYLNNIAKIYLSFFTFFLAIVFIFIKLKFTDNFLSLLSNTLKECEVIIFCYCGSALLIFSSYFFTIWVLRMRREYERLCKPEKFIRRAEKIENESRLLSIIIADYGVATDRNFIANQKKSSLLTKALISYITGIIFFLFAGILYKIIL